MMFAILLLFIFFRPFISSLAYPYANTAYSLILLGLLGLWIISKKIRFQEFKDIKYPLILFPCALLISSVFSSDKLNSFAVLYQYASGMLIFLICASFVDRDRILLIRVILSAGIIISVLAIHQYFFGFAKLASLVAQEGINDPFVNDYISSRRVFVPFVTPNILAGYLAMIMPIAFIHKHKFWLLIPIAAAAFLTRSLGGLAVIPIAILIYFLLDKEAKKRKVIFVLSCLVIAVAAATILRFSTQKLHQHPVFSTIMRLDYLGETLKIIAYAPFKGIGPGNFTLPASRYAHNSYLQLWGECGIIGLLAFLWFIAAVIDQSIKALGKSKRKREISCLFCANLVFLLHNLVDFTFYLPEVGFIWWAILGLLYSFSRESLSES
ncbi:MAG: O-antigen ligase family protein [Candidatus Omnitrophica bacterium]|nr:O-antigen ligase family protein [Candidatus Omnitrophota bacterium]